MQISQHIAEGYPDVKDLLRGEASPSYFLELVFQGLSLDIIHHDIPVIRIGKVIMYAGNVIMFQLGEAPNFAVKRIRRLDHLLWAELAQVDLLDRDEPSMLVKIFCLVDDAEPTITHLIEDAVALGEESTRVQCSSTCSHGEREKCSNCLHRWRRSAEVLTTDGTRCRLCCKRSAAFITKESRGHGCYRAFSSAASATS